MSDSEDDFVEVACYQSSDSEWEKIDDSGSEEEVTKAADKGWTHELVASYYRPPDGAHVKHLHEREVPTLSSVKTEENTLAKPIQPSRKENLLWEATNETSMRSAKPKKESGRKKKHWTKMPAKRELGAPHDPVEFLGITKSEKTLLSRYSIITIGQLAVFNAMTLVNDADPETLATLLDLQERAYEAATDYVTKTSAQPETVWGYLYLGRAALKRVLENGYLESESLYFLWSPMPTVAYRNTLAIDDLIGRETKNRELRDRYSRVLKIDLTRLCKKHYARLYQKDPIHFTGPSKWASLSLMEAALLAQRDDLWHSFEPGYNVYEHVVHGSIVIPTGKIPQECLELDDGTSVFSAAVQDGYESDNGDDQEDHAAVAANLVCDRMALPRFD